MKHISKPPCEASARSLINYANVRTRYWQDENSEDIGLLQLQHKTWFPATFPSALASRRKAYLNHPVKQSAHIQQFEYCWGNCNEIWYCRM